MARPRSIPYNKRVSIFLDYRRGGRKVYPVAITHGVARSTVGLVVKEFREAGFSDRPRIDLPKDLLMEAENSHQLEIIKELNRPPIISVPEPEGLVRGGLTVSDALDADSGNILRGRPGVALNESLVWHLKGTEAEKTIQKVEMAIVEYKMRCLTFWQRIRGDLETETGYPVASPMVGDAIQGGQLYPDLVDDVYLKLCALGARNETLQPSWPMLQVRPESSDEVELANSAVARVPEDPEKVPVIILNSVQSRADDYLAQAKSLAATYGDLQYVLPYAQKQLGEVGPDQVEMGICPECPYPEAALDSGPTEQTKG